MTQEEFNEAVRQGRFIKRGDGTYVEARKTESGSFTKEGVSRAVCSGNPTPRTNVSREFGAGVAGVMFRTSVILDGIRNKRSN